MTDISPAQKIVFEEYAEGDFAWYLEEITSQEELDEVLDTDRKRFGDTLFVLLLIELSPKEDCHDLTDARRRIERAVEDLMPVKWALDAADD